MNFSSLCQSYADMREPSFCLKVDGTSLNTGSGVRLLRAESELTSTRQAGMLLLEIELDPESSAGSAWLNALQPGASCSFSLGYGSSLTQVFCGFLCDILWGDPLGGQRIALEAMCLDVRGQLMLASQSDAGAGRTASQLISGILGQSCCTRLASKRTIQTLPEEWDIPVRRSGLTDYEVLCTAADFLCWEFYAYADELYFGVPRPENAPSVTFDGPNGLTALRRGRTLAGQCAAITVSGTDDCGARICSRQARRPDRGFGTDKMGRVLTGDLCQPEAFTRTMAQAGYLSRARMERLQRQAGRLDGQSTGLPELRPGRFIQVTGLSSAVNGTYYVHTVRHILDETGFQTWFHAED